MKKIILSLVICFLGNFITKADEGMWIPALLEKLNEKEMKEMGMRISAKDIYNINNSSIKDAIVHIGGCTAEIISDQGLLITNHHCGYRRIQQHSSLEHDYLTDGFWAMRKSEELPNPGMIAKFLIRIDDVTDEVLQDVTASLTEVERKKTIDAQIKLIIEKAEKESEYNAVIRPFYYGNQYFMFITQTYKDVRLVGAPPSNIGKFGGDTDNWMWPRHTGDFSIFRVYADKNNNPAEYSEYNVPYKPKYHLPISLKGANEGDFTFVYGYPGRTQEYIPSFGVDLTVNVVNPVIIDLRTEKLKIYKKYIEQDRKVRIQYASKAASVSNAWKKWIGANKGIQRFDGIVKKQKFEKDFTRWANSSSSLNPQYGNLISDFEKIYAELAPYRKASTLLKEGGNSIEVIRFASGFKLLMEMEDQEKAKKTLAKKLEDVTKFFKDYHQPIDREVFEKMLSMYRNASDPAFLPEFFNTIQTNYKGDIGKFADHIFKKSIFLSESKLTTFLNNVKPGKFKKLINDPVYQLASQLANLNNDKLKPQITKLENELNKLLRIYMKAQMEMHPDKGFYPDANSTLRVSYGKIKKFDPMDAVSYKHFTTMAGIIEKEDPNIYDYVVENKLKELYQNKDYGRYADKDGTMHVCFIAANHTSGGNSGSPVLNADGHLLGLNFDRNWEGTMSDLMYDPDYCRNISVDIRYCLLIIDKFAGATRLVNEMTIIE
ncbi:MAG: S46 family peptidase [Bacteroidetes bacterium]|nr:S46 family peptidase [Bacteroidota bacterium]